MGSYSRPVKRTRSHYSGYSVKSVAGAKSLASSAARPVNGYKQKKHWPYSTRKSYMLYWDPFPARQCARLRYSQSLTLSATAGTPGYNLFRCGSIYDPDYTGAGHQPYGHDTYAAIYNHYRVLRSTCTVSTVNSPSGILGCSIKDDSTVEGNYDTIREAKGTNYIVLNSAGSKNKVMQWYSDKMLPDTARNSSTMGANPADDMYFHVWYEAATSTGTGTANIVVDIVYDVYMYELKDLGQS